MGQYMGLLKCVLVYAYAMGLVMGLGMGSDTIDGHNGKLQHSCKLEKEFEAYSEDELHSRLIFCRVDLTSRLCVDPSRAMLASKVPCEICQSLRRFKDHSTVCVSNCEMKMLTSPPQESINIDTAKDKKSSSDAIKRPRVLKYCQAVCDGLKLFSKAHDPCFGTGSCSHVPEQSLPDYRPVVLMHGLDSDAGSMETISSWIQEHLQNIFVLNVELGDGRCYSVFTPLEQQVADFNEHVQVSAKRHPILKHGFNLLGFSQGTLITRGYVQMYNDPPVHNYISYSGPQAGVFGLPKFFNIEFIDKLLNKFAYRAWAQSELAPAGYWRDPFNEQLYLSNSSFLAKLNNGLPGQHVESYKRNMISLNTMVMSYSPIDDVVNPPISGWFAFFKDGSDEKVVPYEETPLFKEDWIGLKTLHDSGRLVTFKDFCKHSDHRLDCGHKYFIVEELHYLNNCVSGECPTALSIASIGKGGEEYEGVAIRHNLVDTWMAIISLLALMILGIFLYAEGDRLFSTDPSFGASRNCQNNMYHWAPGGGVVSPYSSAGNCSEYESSPESVTCDEKRHLLTWKARNSIQNV
eukprot:Nk52_evm21s1178 gene=Nk52_evmTU21s1178